jgi:hypothetical protein
MMVALLIIFNPNKVEYFKDVSIRIDTMQQEKVYVYTYI